MKHTHMSRVLAAVLSLSMALAPLSACSSATKTAPVTDEEGEEVVKDLTFADGAGEENIKQLDYNVDGTYTVSFAEGDLYVLNDEELATAKKEMGEAKSTGTATTSDDKADDKGIVEDEGIAEDDGKASDDKSQKAVDEAKAAYEEAQKELEELQATADDESVVVDEQAVADAEAALQDAQAAADEAQAALDDAQAVAEVGDDQTVADAEQALDEANKAVADAQKALDDAQEADIEEDADEQGAIEEAQAKVDEAKAAYEEAQAALEVEDEAALEAADEAEAVSKDTDAQDKAAFDDIEQNDVQVAYVVVTNMDEYVAGIGEDGEPTVEIEDENRLAEITSFENEGGTITIGFTDVDAATELTNSYIVYIDKLGACCRVSIEFTDVEVNSETEFVASTSEANDIVLSLAEGTWSQDVSADDVSLGGSFKEMTIEGVTLADDQLTLSLKGAPVLESDISTTFTNGTVTLAARAFEGGSFDQSVAIPVEVPNVWVDLTSMDVDGDTITMPIDVDGMDVESITADSIDFGENATVTDVQTGDDGRLVVTVQANTSSEDVDAAIDAIADTDITVGEVTTTSNVGHATFDQRFDFIAVEDEDFTLTINLQAVNGTFADGISADDVTLAGELEGGSVTSLTRVDDTTCELVISVPNNGLTEETYNILGSVTLAEGALVETWGDPAPEATSSRNYAPESLGRDDEIIEEEPEWKEDADEDLEFPEAEDYFYDLNRMFNNENEYEADGWVDIDDNTKKKVITDYNIDKMEKSIAAENKKKEEEFEKKYKQGLNDAVKGFGYAVQVMKYIDKDAAMIMEYEMQGLSILNNIVQGKYVDVAGNVIKILEMSGVLKAPKEATINDVLNELDEMKEYMGVMNAKIDETLGQAYTNRLSTFEENLVKLTTACTNIEGWFKEARQIAVLRKDIKAVDKNSTPKEVAAYNKALVDIIKKRHPDYLIERKDLADRIDNITAAILAGNNTDVIYTYDNLIRTYYNWETQGYTARNSFRTNIKLVLNRAFTNLYNIYDLANNPADQHGTLESIDNAVKQIDKKSPGISLAQVEKQGYDYGVFTKARGIYSPTLNMKTSRMTWSSGSIAGQKEISKTEIGEYKKRLHGNTLVDDLKSAGILSEDFSIGKDEKINLGFTSLTVNTADNYLGIGMRNWWEWSAIWIEGPFTWKKYPRYYADVWKWDGGIAEKEPTAYQRDGMVPKYTIVFYE